MNYFINFPILYLDLFRGKNMDCRQVYAKRNPFLRKTPLHVRVVVIVMPKRLKAHKASFCLFLYVQQLMIHSSGALKKEKGPKIKT